jgi:hypothetical protein
VHPKRLNHPQEGKSSSLVDAIRTLRDGQG